ADGTFAVTADVADAGGLDAPQASASLVVDQTPPTIAITSLGAGLDDVLNAAEQAAGITVSGTTNAEDGQTVTVSVNGVSIETTASAGAWSAAFTGANLAGIGTVEGTSVAVTADVSDAAGNAAAQASTTLAVDTVAPTVVHLLGDETVINIAERAAGLTLTGSTGAPDGATVLIEFFDAGGATVGTASGTATAGTYSIAVAAGTLAGLPDGATLTLRASAADAAGNVGEDTETITTDFTAPAVALDALPEFLNLASTASDQTITGTAEAGASVVVTVNGAALAPVTATGGVWSVTIPANDVQGLPDNSTITVSAVATDAAGNPSAAAEGTFKTDFTPPTITLSGPEGTLVLGLADLEEDGNVDGTTDLPDGATITAEFLNAGGTVIGTKTATVTGGAFDVLFTSAELKALLADGQTYTVRASGADAAGNPASSEFDFDTD
ncbi:MAG: hypothetical protein EBS68_16885, partial [Rhodobacteraceae bacterium]|nr:hypothetical protein [Paracoccaceae bacterium]